VIAVTHPGHIGDMLWAVPCARALAERHGCQVDFWTSSHCRNALDLLQAQSFVRHALVEELYTAQSGGCGIQPWHMGRVDGVPGYEHVYHLGFRETPFCPIPEYYCRLVGLPQQENRWDMPGGMAPVVIYDADVLRPPQQFVALAARGGTSFKECFREFVRRCPLPVLEVGAPGDAVATDVKALNCTSVGFLPMARVIARCKVFVGLLSAPWVVACGFPVVRVGCHEGRNDMRHVIGHPLNHYPQGHDPAPLLEIVKGAL
jgi:hypothetical protein